MFKTPIIITFVMLAVVVATLSHGIISAACCLFAFSLLFYLVATRQDDQSPKE